VSQQTVWTAITVWHSQYTTGKRLYDLVATMRYGNTNL